MILNLFKILLYGTFITTKISRSTVFTELNTYHSVSQVTDVGAELSFILPSDAASQFHGLFTALEST